MQTATSAAPISAASSLGSRGPTALTRPRAAAGTCGRSGRRLSRSQTSVSVSPGVRATSRISARASGRLSVDQVATIARPLVRRGANTGSITSGTIAYSPRYSVAARSAARELVAISASIRAR